ncbi:helix-turn-helix transcriptional regulator [Rhodococcus daqingensis]|uniref:LuxR C-terminal-related transcriptional regulator n=1 Tax=Rhodococcus daqingensis TaxID=2479363 RepID=A0ABW2RXU3_9NOCA
MTGSGLLVGRRKELDELEQLLDETRTGSLLAIVEGSSGTGKSTLVHHFLDRHADLTVASAGGARWEAHHPYAVAEQLLRGPVQRVDPFEVAPDLLQLCEGTTILAVDDAHWADLESLQALSSAVRRAHSHRLLVILIVPDEPPEAVTDGVAQFLAEHHAHRVHVGALTAADVAALARRLIGVDLSGRTARQLCEHTQGNPRLLRQLLDEVPHKRWLEWHASLPVPRAIAASVRRTLHSLSPATRSVIESAAVLGQDCTFSEVARLSVVDQPMTALDEASAAGVLVVRNRRGETTVRFPDPIVKAAVEAQVLPARRQDLHIRAADLVETEGGRLHHLVSATTVTDADLADRLVDYARRQASVGAWSEVADALITASRLSPDTSDREDRLVRGVDALVGAGDLPQALAFEPEIGSGRGGARRDAVLGYLAILRGRPAEAERLLGKAWEQCDPVRDPDTAALIAQRMVLHSLGRLRGAELVEWVDRAVALVDIDDPAAVESEAIKGLGLAAMGRVDDARAAYAELETRARLGAQAQRFRMGKGWLDLSLDDPETARRELESAVPTVYRSGSVRISLWAQAWLARAHFVLGSWDEAIATVNRAAAQIDDLGLELVRPLVHWTGAVTHALRGNWSESRDHLNRADAATNNYEIMLVPACLARAQCAEVVADYESVIRFLGPLTALQSRGGLDEPGTWPWPDLYANALVMTGRVDEADEFLRPHERLAARRGHRSASARLGYARGRIEGARGNIDAAREVFETALQQLSILPLPYDRARVTFAYGQTLRRAGKRREADAVMRSARELYATLGATTYVERCDRELKAGGLHIKRTGPNRADLTPQEQAVADLVAAGRSNKDVAGELFLSVKTVQYHLTRIYAKLGIRSRSELAAHFREQE